MTTYAWQQSPLSVCGSFTIPCKHTDTQSSKFLVDLQNTITFIHNHHSIIRPMITAVLNTITATISMDIVYNLHDRSQAGRDWYIKTEHIPYVDIDQISSANVRLLVCVQPSTKTRYQKFSAVMKAALCKTFSGQRIVAIGTFRMFDTDTGKDICIPKDWKIYSLPGQRLTIIMVFQLIDPNCVPCPFCNSLSESRGDGNTRCHSCGGSLQKLIDGSKGSTLFWFRRQVAEQAES